MSLTGSRNTLIGYGAVLPNPGADNQVVVGSAADTVYIGGTAGLIVNQATGVQLPAAGPLIVNFSEGSAGLPLVSNGPDLPPYWQPIPVTVRSTTTINSPVAGLYVINSLDHVVLTLPALGAGSSFIGNSLVIKARSSATINVAGSGTITQGIGPVSSISMSAGDVAEFISSATTWYIVSQNRAFPLP